MIHLVKTGAVEVFLRCLRGCEVEQRPLERTPQTTDKAGYVEVNIIFFTLFLEPKQHAQLKR